MHRLHSPDFAPDGALHLVRRGVSHGHLEIDDQATATLEAVDDRWNTAEPIWLPGALAERLDKFEREIEATRAMFEAVRRGDRFLDLIDSRFGETEFRYVGSTVQQDEQREIERLFIDVPAADRGVRRIRDLTMRLSWIADDPNDQSLRIRFSFGHEATRDWLAADERALWSDALAEQVFPECAIVTEHDQLLGLLSVLLDAPFRLSERIVYSNVPGGGAVFHHDADPGQLGVCYSQLQGRTVWLAAPRAELARLAAQSAPANSALSSAEAVQAAMDEGPNEELWDLLNRTPALTASLCDAGYLFVLEEGDVILLPSHDVQRVAWHSVFGVGEEPSLAHSYGLFPAVESEDRTASVSESP